MKIPTFNFYKILKSQWNVTSPPIRNVARSGDRSEDLSLVAARHTPHYRRKNAQCKRHGPVYSDALSIYSPGLPLNTLINKARALTPNDPMRYLSGFVTSIHIIHTESLYICGPYTAEPGLYGVYHLQSRECIGKSCFLVKLRVREEWKVEVLGLWTLPVRGQISGLFGILNLIVMHSRSWNFVKRFFLFSVLENFLCCFKIT